MYNWNGTFIPVSNKETVKKHRLNTGSLSNHLNVISWNADEEKNKIIALVEWIESDDSPFEIITDIPYSGNNQALTDNRVKDKIVAQVRQELKQKHSEEKKKEDNDDEVIL